MSNFLFSILGFVIVLGILVIVHEFGHFWVARRLGVKVLRFSVGFGKPLWSKRAGPDDTEYAIAAIPLGGYVKMLDENEGEVPAAERHRAFNRQSVFTRSLIVLAGPLANLLFAVLAYWAVYMVGIDGIRPVVGQVLAGSVAAQGGFRSGDEILTIDGRETQAWDEHRMYLFNRALAGSLVTIVVRDADGRERKRVLDLSALRMQELDAGFLERAVGLSVYRPPVPPIIAKVVAQSPAEGAGIQAGDRIVAVGGTPVNSWLEVVVYVRQHPGQKIRLGLERPGLGLIDLELIPESVSDGTQVIGQIGVLPEPVKMPASMRVTVRYGPLAALWRGVENTWGMSTLTVKMLVRMLKLEVSAKNISGPLTIAQYAGHSVQLGLDRFLLFLAIVSISLGVLNLLPIPILDGGHLMYYLVEGIIGRAIPKRVMLWGQQIGILLLVGLMALAFYNDFVRLLQ